MPNLATLPDLSTHLLHTIADACWRQGIPLILWGEPGTGKTASIELLASENEAELVAIAAPRVDPSTLELKSLSVPDEQGRRFTLTSPPDWAARADSGAKMVLFIDELGAAAPAIQNAFLTIIQSREIGSYHLGLNVLIIVAANPSTDSLVAFDLVAPMANRLSHWHFKPTIEEFLHGLVRRWGRENVTPQEEELALQVAAFLRDRSDLRLQVPETIEMAGGPWPSPRSWDNAITLAGNAPQDDIAAIFTSEVGSLATSTFMVFREGFAVPPVETLLDPKFNWQGISSQLTFAALMKLIRHMEEHPSVETYGKVGDVFERIAHTTSKDSGAALVLDYMTSPAKGKAPLHKGVLKEYNNIVARVLR